jgi:hypothetical protein
LPPSNLLHSPHHFRWFVGSRSVMSEPVDFIFNTLMTVYGLLHHSFWRDIRRWGGNSTAQDLFPLQFIHFPETTDNVSTWGYLNTLGDWPISGVRTENPCLIHHPLILMLCYSRLCLSSQLFESREPVPSGLRPLTICWKRKAVLIYQIKQ